MFLIAQNYHTLLKKICLVIGKAWYQFEHDEEWECVRAHNNFIPILKLRNRQVY